jgi:tetratricopeptide (TPR) repeat protein
MSAEAVKTGTAFDDAVALHRAGRDDAALARCETALAAEPGRGDAWRLKAVLLSRLADPDGALAALARAIALDPANPDLRFQQASLMIHLDRKPDAIGTLDALLTIAPDRIDALRLVASLKRETGDIAGAIAAGEALIKLQPGDAVAWFSLGRSHRQAFDWPRAEACLRQAASLDPALVPAQIQHAMALVALGDAAAALAAADRALALDPDNEDASDARAAALRDLGRAPEGLEAVKTILERNPAHRGALLRHGLLLHDLGDPEAACIAYDRLLVLDPDHVDAHWNRGAALLALGRLEEGFAEYEWRLRSTLFYRGKPRHAQPRWDGTKLAGRAILIHAEQGFGDTIQFLRYLPIVASATDRVWLELPPPLKPLVAASGLAGELFAPGDALPDFDCRASLMSLPHLTGVMPGDARLPMPYLRADPVRVARWCARLEVSATAHWHLLARQSRPYPRSRPLARARCAALPVRSAGDLRQPAAAGCVARNRSRRSRVADRRHLGRHGSRRRVSRYRCADDVARPGGDGRHRDRASRRRARPARAPAAAQESGFPLDAGPQRHTLVSLAHVVAATARRRLVRPDCNGGGDDFAACGTWLTKRNGGAIPKRISMPRSSITRPVA